MPDFIFETFFHCSSCEQFTTKVKGSRGKEYTVSYGKTYKDKLFEHDWSCTCDSYKFGKGAPCKHIKQVMISSEFCGWNQFTDGGEPVLKGGEFFCPKCGQAAFSLRYAV